MKFVVLLIVLSSFFMSCGPLKTGAKTLNYELVEVPVIYENDTVISYELRFSQVTSAMISMQFLYNTFGNWDEELDGRYQSNISQLVWQNVDLLQNEDLYTVAASGTETGTEFFTFVMVFDEKGRDVLDPNHPAREVVIAYFVNGLQHTQNTSDFLSVYKNKEGRL